MIPGFSRFILFFACSFLLFGCQPEVKITKKTKSEIRSNQFQFPKFNPLPKSFVPHYYDSISQFYRSRIAPDFNGMFLVAKNGEIVYERYKCDEICSNRIIHLVLRRKVIRHCAVAIPEIPLVIIRIRTSVCESNR